MTPAVRNILAFILTVSCAGAAPAAEPVRLKYSQAFYGNAASALNQPQGVACGGPSPLVVADSGNKRLLRFAFKNQVGEVAGVIQAPELSDPTRLAMNSQGGLLVLDGKQHRILRFGPDGQFAGVLSLAEAPAPAVFPAGIAVGRNDDLHVLDIIGARVLVLNADGKYQRQVLFPDEYGFVSGLAVDRKGTILLIDSVYAQVYAASGSAAKFSPLTKRMQDTLELPTDIAADAQGNIFIVDRSSGSITILGPDGSFQGRQLGRGWKEGLLHYPAQLCIDQKGWLFIADRNNNRVQVFTMVH